MTGRRMLGTVAVVVVLVAVLPALAVGGADDHDSTDPPETADDYLRAFQAMDGTASFEEYTELEALRETGISTVQVGTFDEATRQEVELLYELLVEFESAYDHAQAGNETASLEAAERAANRSESLQEVGASYAVLGELALNRFFSERAEQLFDEAEELDRTTDRLERLELASRAIQGSGRTDDGIADEILVQIEKLSAELDRDQDQINETVDGATAFVDGCADCTSTTGALGDAGFGVFGAYARSLEHASALRSASDLAAGHGLDERSQEIESTQAAVEQRQWALAGAAVTLLAGFLLVVGPVATLLTARVGRWREDTLEAQTGNDVFAEEIRDA